MCLCRNRRSDTRTDKIAIVSYPGKIHSKVGNNHVPILHTAQHKKSFRTPDNCRVCPCKLWKKRNKVKKFFNTRQTTKYHMTLSNTLIRNEIKCFNFISVQHICYWKKWIMDIYEQNKTKNRNCEPCFFILPLLKKSRDCWQRNQNLIIFLVQSAMLLVLRNILFSLWSPLTCSVCFLEKSARTNSIFLSFPWSLSLWNKWYWKDYSYQRFGLAPGHLFQIED